MAETTAPVFPSGFIRNVAAPIKVKSATYTETQLHTAFGGGIGGSLILLPAPGAGKLIEPIALAISINWTATGTNMGLSGVIGTFASAFFSSPLWMQNGVNGLQGGLMAVTTLNMTPAQYATALNGAFILKNTTAAMPAGAHCTAAGFRVDLTYRIHKSTS